MTAKENIIKKVSAILRGLPQGIILATVSGGADSVALLRALLMCGRKVEVANCNFHLRGDESDRDSAFVAKLCGTMEVTLHTTNFGAARYAEEKGVSIEMACRDLRHQWFADIAEQIGAVRIATGHNIGDNIETMLLNLLRGSGTSGLKGMPADNGKIVRPLLNCTRDEIIEFLGEMGQDYVTDSTNLESDYRRNFLRNEVLPLLRSKWEGVDVSLARSIRLIEAENKIVEKAVDETLKEVKDCLGWELINGFADPQTLVFRYLQRSGESSSVAGEIARDIERSLPTPRYGSWWHLADGRFAVAEQCGLRIVTEKREGEGTLVWNKEEITEANRNDIMQKVKTAPLTEVWLPGRREDYKMRVVYEGERFEPLGMRGSRLISDILHEAGVPTVLRKGVKILIRKRDNKGIWIPGIKRSRHELIGSEAVEIWHIKKFFG